MQRLRRSVGTALRPTLRLAAVAASLAIATGLALAQITGPTGIGDPTTRRAGGAQQTQSGPVGVQPPTPNRADSPPTPLYYGVIVVLAGATVALAIMPSKRGHQD